jgi:hypothetical protein
MLPHCVRVVRLGVDRNVAAEMTMSFAVAVEKERVR